MKKNNWFESDTHVRATCYQSCYFDQVFFLCRNHKKVYERKFNEQTGRVYKESGKYRSYQDLFDAGYRFTGHVKIKKSDIWEENENPS